MPAEDQPVFAIVTVLPAEAKPVRMLLDEMRHVTAAGDGAEYTLGTMPSRVPGSPHSVVVRVLGETGNTRAAAACANLLRTFPTIRFLLMVGTAAGVPNADDPDAHVALGDIVVATRGVVEYDHVDDNVGRRAQRGQIPPASELLTRCARSLAEAELDDVRPWDGWIANVQLVCPRFARPDTGRPKVHLIKIGSGNTALSNAATRDELAADLGLSAFDMESAGVAVMASDGREWLCVRGISDHGDAGRTKRWRPFAALAAAAYVRALLDECPPQEPLTNRRARPERRISGRKASVAVVAVLAVVGWLLLAGRDDDPLPITDLVSVDNGQNMTVESVASIAVPVPPERRHLGLTVDLKNPSRVGDCLNLARMEFTTRVDGERRPMRRDLPEGREVPIDLDGARRSATVLIRITLPDDECRVDLSVAKAVLFD